MPKSEKCFYIKNKILINNIIKKQINEEIQNKFNDDYLLYNISQDFSGDANKKNEIKNDNKKENQIQFGKELKENLEIEKR